MLFVFELLKPCDSQGIHDKQLFRMNKTFAEYQKPLFKDQPTAGAHNLNETANQSRWSLKGHKLR